MTKEIQLIKLFYRCVIKNGSVHCCTDTSIKLFLLIEFPGYGFLMELKLIALSANGPL